MNSGSRLDDGSLLEAPADACFLLTTTAVGQTLVALEQHALQAALEVYASDPFPLQDADWPALLDGTLAAFFRPRDLYALSYFMTVAQKQWEARIAACRALAEARRAVGAGLEEIFAAASGPAQLLRRAAWRALAACDPLRGPAPGALFAGVRRALDGREAPAEAARLPEAATAADLDAALDAATALGRHPPLPPFPALPAAPGGPALDAVLEKLARVREEVATRGPALHAAWLARSGGFEALTPLSPGAADPGQLWRYAWARKMFRGEGALLAAVEAAFRAEGRAVPESPRVAA